MNYEERRDAFLKEYLADRPFDNVRKFYETAFKILEFLEPPIMVDAGLACIELLHLVPIVRLM